MSMTKPWQTAEWKQRREEFLKGKKCRECGSCDDLDIHYLTSIPDYSHYYNEVRDQIIRRQVDNGELDSKKKDACPNCKLATIKARKQSRKPSQPLYRCSTCRNEFGEPVKVPTYKLAKETYQWFIKENDDTIRKAVEDMRNEFFRNSYLKFENCVVLCKKCQALIPSGYDFCPQCNGTRKIGHPLCYTCFLQTPEGKKRHEELEELKRIEKELEEDDERFDEYVAMMKTCQDLLGKGKMEEALCLREQYYSKYPDEVRNDDEWNELI